MQEVYDRNVRNILNCPNELHSLQEVEKLHDQVIIEFTSKLLFSGNGRFIPHYRDEQCFGWEILPSLFRGFGMS